MQERREFIGWLLILIMACGFGCVSNNHEQNITITPGSSPQVCAVPAAGDLAITGTDGSVTRITGAIVINMSDNPASSTKPVDVTSSAANGSSWGIGGGAVGGAIGAASGGPAGAAIGAAAGSAVASTAATMLTSTSTAANTGTSKNTVSPNEGGSTDASK